MSKPTHFIVHWGPGFTRREYFACRAAARAFKLAKRLQGIDARIEPRGF